MELDEALRSARRHAIPIAEITRAVFVLPRLQDKLKAVRSELLDGRGFVLIRGLPVERYRRDELATLYWGLGQYIGSARL